MSDFYSFIAKDINGQDLPLSNFIGKTVLVVNTAGKCGFTPQYKGLQELYNKYKEQGLVILGFPCNQFGEQEPGGDQEIKSFCELNFGVNFPLFSKIDVNGDNAHDLFKFLKKELPGFAGTKNIKWNFTKFLVNKEGVPIKRFAPQDTPDKLEVEINKIL